MPRAATSSRPTLMLPLRAFSVRVRWDCAGSPLSGNAPSRRRRACRPCAHLFAAEIGVALRRQQQVDGRLVVLARMIRRDVLDVLVRFARRRALDEQARPEAIRSSSTARGNVAETRWVRRCSEALQGAVDSSSKPRSSIWSASSRTNCDTEEISSPPRRRWSSRRPACRRHRRLALQQAFAVEVGAADHDLAADVLHAARATRALRAPVASSRVGAMISVVGPTRAGSTSLAASAKPITAVFPEPVCDEMRRSLAPS